MSDRSSIVPTEISRVALFGRLDASCYRSIENATVFCKLRGNPYVELEHWVAQLLQEPDGEWSRAISHFRLDAAVLARDTTAALDRLPRDSARIVDFSPRVMHAVERAWLYGSLMYDARAVTSGHLLLGIVKTSPLRQGLVRISREFEKISHEALATALPQMLGSSTPSEGSHQGSGARAASSDAPGTLAPAPLGRRQALEQFTTDLTQQARDGRMDPILGREDEIRQLVDILMRRRQNNPILVGEAGVGKTAVVEGFAQRIVLGDVPPALKDVELRSLDVGLLQAGASMKGEFEQRLRAVIDEVQASPRPVILFIDETHTLVGAGGAAGTGDAANLLKPVLARGELRTIGATTFSEYRKHIEKDPALSRRFQAVTIDEPEEDKALRMLRGLAEKMEAHHRVFVLDEALHAAVSLSTRYIPSRQLPDKAVSLLDTACARVAVSLHTTPAPVDDARRRIEALEAESVLIHREAAVGIDVASREKDASAALALARTELEGLEARWEAERALVDRILALRAALSSPAVDEAPDAEPDAARREMLRDLQAELHTLQGEAPLVQSVVDHQAIAAVVRDWTGIPVGHMARDEMETVLRLPELLSERVIGQDHAMAVIARRIETSRAGLDHPGKPVGVFLLVGPSGVGKTETALALAQALYGGEGSLVTINMSEYQEPHTVSSLKGSPPGYVGYGEGGVLTEAVRRRPYSVVLLDEIEKAHPDVHEMFFQVFDKGQMDDGEGRRIDFRHTLILLTSNVGSDVVSRLCAAGQPSPTPETLARALREPLLQVFPPALLGRLVVVPYRPLDDQMIARIVRLQIERIGARVLERHGAPLRVSDDVVELIVSRCTENESGGRMIDAILSNTILPSLSRGFLARSLQGEAVRGVEVRVAESGQLEYLFS